MKAQRSVLLVVLPYRLGDATTDTSKKAIRSFLAFPYGVLTLASYAKRYARGLSGVEVLDLNLPTGEAPDMVLSRKLAAMRPDIVGFSMSYDVSYQWLRALTEVAKRHDAAACTVAGGKRPCSRRVGPLVEPKFGRSTACCGVRPQFSTP